MQGFFLSCYAGLLYSWVKRTWFLNVEILPPSFPHDIKILYFEITEYCPVSLGQGNEIEFISSREEQTQIHCLYNQMLPHCATVASNIINLLNTIILLYIIKITFQVFYNGYHGDCSKTFLVGDVDDRGLQLVNVTEECLNQVNVVRLMFSSICIIECIWMLSNINIILIFLQAIEICGPGVPFCDIGLRIYRIAKRHKLTVLPAFIGHGIGKYFHGPPDIFHTCK